MQQGYWRSIAAPIIAKVLKETAGQDEATIKKALFDAYPFGERAMYPYDVWRDEIKQQRGLKPKSTLRRNAERQEEANDANLSLF